MLCVELEKKRIHLLKFNAVLKPQVILLEKNRIKDFAILEQYLLIKIECA